MKTIKRWLCKWLGIDKKLDIDKRNIYIYDIKKDIKDNERRIDRLEQCIYGLSISDDVKAVDMLKHVKDLAHQMYGEYQAREGNNEDYLREDLPF